MRVSTEADAHAGTVSTPAPAPQVQRTVITKTIEPAAAPAPSRPEIDGRDLSAFFAGLAPHEWGNFSYFLSRLNPQTKNNDNGTYLYHLKDTDFDAAFAEGFDGFQEWVKTRAEGSGFGGGLYRLRIQTLKGSGMPSKTICCATFEILGAPRLGQREIAAGAAPAPVPANGKPEWQAMLDFLKEQLVGAKQNTVDPQVAVSQAMAMMKAASDQAIQIAVGQVPKAADPLATLAAMIDVLEKIEKRRNPEPAAAPPAANGFDVFEKSLALFERLGLVRKPGDEGPEKPRSIAEQLKEVTDLATSLGFVRAGEGGNAGLWSEIVRAAPGVFRELPGVLEKIRDIAAIRAGVAQPARQPAAVVVGPARPAPGGGGPVLRAIAPAPQPAAAPAPAEKVQTSAVVQPAELTSEQMLSVVSGWIRSKIVDFVQMGVSGDHVAEWLGMSDPRFQAYVGALSKEKIRAEIIAKDDILKVLLEDPRLPPFLDQFVEYFKPDKGEEEAV